MEQDSITDDEIEAVQRGLKTGVQCGPGRRYDLERLAGAIALGQMTWDDSCTQYRIAATIETIGYADDVDFQLLVCDGVLAYSTAMLRQAKTGNYVATYHYMDALHSGITHLQLVGQLMGESIAQLFYGPESTDSVTFQR